jgi:hypothetical protein
MNPCRIKGACTKYVCNFSRFLNTPPPFVMQNRTNPLYIYSGSQQIADLFSIYWFNLFLLKYPLNIFNETLFYCGFRKTRFVDLFWDIPRLMSNFFIFWALSSGKSGPFSIILDTGISRIFLIFVPKCYCTFAFIGFVFMGVLVYYEKTLTGCVLLYFILRQIARSI